MRVARVAGAVVLAGAAVWAVCTVTAYVAFIRGFARSEDNTLATIHPIRNDQANQQMTGRSAFNE